MRIVETIKKNGMDVLSFDINVNIYLTLSNIFKINWDNEVWRPLLVSRGTDHGPKKGHNFLLEKLKLTRIFTFHFNWEKFDKHFLLVCKSVREGILLPLTFDLALPEKIGLKYIFPSFCFEITDTLNSWFLFSSCKNISCHVTYEAYTWLHWLDISHVNSVPQVKWWMTHGPFTCNTMRAP